MGGRSASTSEIDRGSTFWVELARQRRRRRRGRRRLERNDATAVAATAAGVILYIEDNRSNVRLMERVLERRPGVRLLHAARAQIGFAIGRAERPDLIFLDLHLPDMPGEEVLRRLWRTPARASFPSPCSAPTRRREQARRLKASGASPT